MSKNQILAIKVPKGDRIGRMSELKIWERYSTVSVLNATNLLKSAMVVAIISSETSKILAAATVKGVELAGEFNDELRIIGKVLPGTLTGRILDLGVATRMTIYVDDPWNMIKTEPDVVQYYMS